MSYKKNFDKEGWAITHNKVEGIDAGDLLLRNRTEKILVVFDLKSYKHRIVFWNSFGHAYLPSEESGIQREFEDGKFQLIKKYHGAD